MAKSKPTNILDQTGADMVKQVQWWRENPDIAAMDLLNVDLDKHQRVIIRNRWTHDECYDVMGRGAGKTFLNATYAILRALLNPGHKVGLLGKNFRQSKFMFEEIKKIWQKSPTLQRSTISEPKTAADRCYLEFHAAEGQSRSLIEALPLGADGSGIRGARYFDVICDEYAQMDKQIVDLVIRPFLATNPDPMKNVRAIEAAKRGEAPETDAPPANKFIATSSAYYQYNHLWETVSALCNEMQGDLQMAQRRGSDRQGRTPDDFLMMGASVNNQFPHKVMSNGSNCVHVFTCLDPSEGFINRNAIKTARERMGKYEFMMEWLAYFPPDSEGFIQRSLLDAAREHDRFGPIFEPRPGMKYTMGIDPARESDNFAIAIFEVDPDMGDINLVRMITYHRPEWPFVAREIHKLVKQYRMESFAMDAGGGGTTLRDLLADPAHCPTGCQPILEQDYDGHRRKHGRRILEPLVQFGKYEWLHDANHNLRSGLESKKLSIAASPRIWAKHLDDADAELESTLVEISTIVTTTTASGRCRWDTPSKHQRKDRYSAVLVGYDNAHKLLDTTTKPRQLAMGGWGATSRRAA
ncbi:MAG: terminase family protein [Planctomycetota bacterium]